MVRLLQLTPNILTQKSSQLRLIFSVKRIGAKFELFICLLQDVILYIPLSLSVLIEYGD